MCMYTCIYIYIYTYVCINIYIYIYIHIKSESHLYDDRAKDFKDTVFTFQPFHLRVP